MNNVKRLLIFVIFLLAFGGNAASQTHGIPGILDIIQQWAVIEHRFAEDQSYIGREDVEAFCNSIQSFLDSEMYHIFRFVPFSSDAKPIFGPSLPNDIPELRDTINLVRLFSDNLRAGDREKAMLISADISDALTHALVQYREAERFTGVAYFRLLIVFIVFIAMMTLVIRFLYKALTHSLRREAEGSGFTRAVLLAQEGERSRISRELHDTIAQDLRYLSLGMEKIGGTTNTEERKKLCTEAATIHSALIRRVRSICDDLVPPDFRFQGLGDALRRLCLDFGKRTGIDCRSDITAEIEPDFMDEEKQLQVFRIVQEALTNVEKHAQATEAIVILHYDPDGKITVGVSDDGKGFELPGNSAGENTTDSGSAAHLGIRGMKERAMLLGGSLEIKSEKGEGTIVRLELPSKEGS